MSDSKKIWRPHAPRPCAVAWWPATCSTSARNFVRDFVFPAVRAAALYQGEYYLGTSLARPCITRGLMEVAAKEKTNTIAHGATGKGNDQVRFELGAYWFNPSVKIIAPGASGTSSRALK